MGTSSYHVAVYFHNTYYRLNEDESSDDKSGGSKAKTLLAGREIIMLLSV